VGPTSRPVKRLTVTISDGWLRPSEISYVRRLPSDITLFPMPYVRRLETVGDKLKPSDISYVRRFKLMFDSFGRRKLFRLLQCINIFRILVFLYPSRQNL
jgi:hypothetical protein